MRTPVSKKFFELLVRYASMHSLIEGLGTFVAYPFHLHCPFRQDGLLTSNGPRGWWTLMQPLASAPNKKEDPQGTSNAKHNANRGWWWWPKINV